MVSLSPGIASRARGADPFAPPSLAPHDRLVKSQLRIAQARGIACGRGPIAVTLSPAAVSLALRPALGTE